MKQFRVLLLAGVLLAFLGFSNCGLAAKAENHLLRVATNHGTVGEVLQVGYRRRVGGRGKCGGNSTATTIASTTATTSATTIPSTATTTAVTTTTAAATG